jgi:RecB family endonuclease NucS
MSTPSLEDAAELLRRALSTKDFIAMICLCEAEYIGRARSFLERGERLIVVKEDTSFLIHRASELEPVNWQPPPNHFSISMSQNHVTLTVRRIRKPEKIVVKIYGFRSFFSGRLRDEGEFHMYLSEREVSEAVQKHPELLEKGFRIVSTELREDTGIVDISGVDAVGRRTIVEIKKDRAGKEAVRQVLRYVRGIGSGTRVILLAPSVTPEAERMLRKNGVEFKKLSMVELARMIVQEERSEGSITRFLGDQE